MVGSNPTIIESPVEWMEFNMGIRPAQRLHDLARQGPPCVETQIDGWSQRSPIRHLQTIFAMPVIG